MPQKNQFFRFYSKKLIYIELEFEGIFCFMGSSIN